LHISGSGSCLFATSKSHEQTTRWAQQLQERKIAQVLAVNFHDQADPFLEVPYASV
jgi:4-diphosphocytidyl-2C-methyl-D-erythritol kinase